MAYWETEPPQSVYDALAPHCKPGWQGRLAAALEGVKTRDLGDAWHAFWETEGWDRDYFKPKQLELAL